MKVNFSIIIPVYNRPSEMEELLESLSSQSDLNFELVIVEDGSALKADFLIGKYNKYFEINYFFKPNSGPGDTRNFGMSRAKGNYFLFFDSDCVLPPNYIDTVRKYLDLNYVDAYGGPDGALDSFSPLQKAINYSMTSFFTTGGIRGGGEQVEKFNPRSFNMGLSKAVFEKTGGFPLIRFAPAKAAGEDLDLSIQIKKAGFTTALIQEAIVYHKRRTSLKQFFKQVYSFGFARISIYKRHPESLKPLHFAPALFTLGLISLLLLSLLWPYTVAFILLYAFIVFFQSSLLNKNVQIGLLSVATSFAQLVGYGLGFIKSFWIQVIAGRKLQFN